MGWRRLRTLPHPRPEPSTQAASDLSKVLRSSSYPAAHTPDRLPARVPLQARRAKRDAEAAQEEAAAAKEKADAKEAKLQDDAAAAAAARADAETARDELQVRRTRLVQPDHSQPGPGRSTPHHAAARRCVSVHGEAAGADWVCEGSCGPIAVRRVQLRTPMLLRLQLRRPALRLRHSCSALLSGMRSMQR